MSDYSPFYSILYRLNQGNIKSGLLSKYLYAKKFLLSDWLDFIYEEGDDIYTYIIFYLLS